MPNAAHQKELHLDDQCAPDRQRPTRHQHIGMVHQPRQLCHTISVCSRNAAQSTHSFLAVHKGCCRANSSSQRLQHAQKAKEERRRFNRVLRLRRNRPKAAITATIQSISKPISTFVPSLQRNPKRSGRGIFIQSQSWKPLQSDGHKPDPQPKAPGPPVPEEVEWLVQ